MAPFFPSFGRLTLTPIPSSLTSTSEFARSCCPSLPGELSDIDGDKESVAKDAKVDAAVCTAAALKRQSQGERYFIMRVEHTMVAQWLRGRLMSSFSIAQVKTSSGACGAGTTAS